MSRTPALKARLAHCQGRHEATAAQLAAAQTRLAESGARLSLEPAVKELLERLQNRVMSRSVGGLQALLSAILNDVFPGKGDVVLTVSSLRGAPALDIYLDNQGQLEDALEGSGGAVDNVLSAGLRYSALMRTQNRRLMVMDEPDCWMRPDKVPAFVGVLRQVSEEVGVQTLLVSHHDESFFTGSASMVYIAREDGVPIASQLAGAKSWPDNDEPGLRSLRLINFKAHADTLIPLCPGMNALIGENDLGKSTAFVAALRAVAYGESDDTCIRHGADKAVIEITLEKGLVIEWTRVREGSPKVVYRVLAADGTTLHEGRQQSRGAAPEWVDDLLGVRQVDGLDIQLRSQKTPVFLLDEPPARRAQVLSVGREASHLATLMDSYRELVRRDRETQTRDGKVATKLESSVNLVADSLRAAAEKLQVAESQEQAIREAQRKAEAYLKASQALRRQAIGASVAIPEQLAVPVVQDPALLAKRAGLLRKLEAASSAEIPAPLVAPHAPEAKFLTEPRRRAGVLRRLAQAADALVPEPLTLPTIPDTKRLLVAARRLGVLLQASEAVVPSPVQQPDASAAVSAKALREAAQIATMTAKDHALATDALPATVQALDELKAELGVCPTCGEEFKHEHAH